MSLFIIFIIYHYLSLFIIIYHYLSLVIIIYHYLSLFIIIYHYLSLFIIIIIYHYHYLLLSSSLCIIIIIIIIMFRDSNTMCISLGNETEAMEAFQNPDVFYKTFTYMFADGSTSVNCTAGNDTAVIDGCQNTTHLLVNNTGCSSTAFASSGSFCCIFRIVWYIW